MQLFLHNGSIPTVVALQARCTMGRVFLNQWEEAWAAGFFTSLSPVSSL